MKKYHKNWVLKFDVNEAFLPFLAIDSALYINSCLNGIHEQDGAVYHLSAILRDFVDKRDSCKSFKENSLVLRNAIYGRKNSKELENLVKDEEVLLQTCLLSKELKDFNILSEEKQRNLYDFCIKLGSEAEYYNTYFSKNKANF